MVLPEVLVRRKHGHFSQGDCAHHALHSVNEPSGVSRVVPVLKVAPERPVVEHKGLHRQKRSEPSFLELRDSGAVRAAPLWEDLNGNRFPFSG
jgi:hypothetical protein